MNYEIDNRDSRTTELHTKEGTITVDPVELVENAIENYNAPLLVRIALWILKKLM